MPNLVCTGATLRCSYGTATATFSATGATVSAGAAAGVVSDIATANVPPFGNCMSLNNPAVNSATQAAGGSTLVPQPCMPVVTNDWTSGAAQVTVGPAAALTSSSQCSCSWNGAITVTDPGQSRVTLA
jgi:hypothetical protein